MENKDKLQLIYISYEQAVEFAGEYGMNAILYDKEKTTMCMARLNNENSKLYATTQGMWGPHKEAVDAQKYDIYWIGGTNNG